MPFSDIVTPKENQIQVRSLPEVDFSGVREGLKHLASAFETEKPDRASEISKYATEAQRTYEKYAGKGSIAQRSQTELYLKDLATRRPDVYIDVLKKFNEISGLGFFEYPEYKAEMDAKSEGLKKAYSLGLQHIPLYQNEDGSPNQLLMLKKIQETEAAAEALKSDDENVRIRSQEKVNLSNDAAMRSVAMGQLVKVMEDPNLSVGEKATRVKQWILLAENQYRDYYYRTAVEIGVTDIKKYVEDRLAISMAAYKPLIDQEGGLVHSQIEMFKLNNSYNSLKFQNDHPELTNLLTIGGPVLGMVMQQAYQTNKKELDPLVKGVGKELISVMSGNYESVAPKAASALGNTSAKLYNQQNILSNGKVDKTQEELLEHAINAYYYSSSKKGDGTEPIGYNRLGTGLKELNNPNVINGLKEILKTDRTKGLKLSGNLIDTNRKYASSAFHELDKVLKTSQINYNAKTQQFELSFSQDRYVSTTKGEKGQKEFRALGEKLSYEPGKVATEDRDLFMEKISSIESSIKTINELNKLRGGRELTPEDLQAMGIGVIGIEQTPNGEKTETSDKSKEEVKETGTNTMRYYDPELGDFVER